MQLVFRQRSLIVALLPPGGLARAEPASAPHACAVAMPAEGPPIDAAHWSRQIAAVAATQDRAAFAALFEHFAPRVKTFMLRSGASEACAEEVAQEAMLSVWRKAALFDPATSGAAAWIFTIARNLRIDALRRERRGGTRDPDADIDQGVDDAPPADARFAAVEAEARVRAALAELSEEQMRVVELSFFEDKAHGEIAGLLRIPLGTVKSRLRLAMNRLRTLLDDPHAAR